MGEVMRHPSLTREQLLSKIGVVKDEIQKRFYKIISDTLTCIDGRDKNKKSASVPGAEVGVIGVVFAYLDQNNIDVSRSIVSGFIKNYFGGELHGHSDLTKNQTHKCQGCGHVERLLTQSKHYLLTNEESVQELKNLIGEIPEENIDIYTEGHQERNVFIVNDEKYGIFANSEFGQDFVYNKGYVEAMYRDLIEQLKAELGLEIDIDSIHQIANTHFMNTGTQLAAGKDVFSVSNLGADMKLEDIEYVMTVPEKLAA